eukprot:1360744-Alexandrium_andersonii.AAC.1
MCIRDSSAFRTLALEHAGVQLGHGSHRRNSLPQDFVRLFRGLSVELRVVQEAPQNVPVSDSDSDSEHADEADENIADAGELLADQVRSWAPRLRSTSTNPALDQVQIEAMLAWMQKMVDIFRVGSFSLASRRRAHGGVA